VCYESSMHGSFGGLQRELSSIHSGLAGMPRRIPAYPEIYLYLNKISSIGSLISVGSVVIFFIILYRIFSITVRKVMR